MEDTPYLEVDRRVMGLLKDAFGDTFKGTFIGKVDSLPKDAYPALIVHLEDGSSTAGATMTDDIVETLQIYIWVNMKDGFNTPDDDDNVMRQLQTLVSGKDPTTGYYLPNTVLSVIRQNITLNDSIIDSTVKYEYNTVPHPTEPWVAEAFITMQIQSRAFLPNRT